MTCLVTGGTGLIGSRIVRDLAREGEKVVVYDWFPNTTVLEQLLNEKERTRVKVVQGDVTDLAHLIHAVKENDVEKIFHMAYLLSHMSAANPSLAIRINCEGTNNVFETARILGVKRVIWPGGHIEQSAGANESEVAVFPSSVYEGCKKFDTVLADHYFNHYGVEIVGVSFPLVYGAGQRPGGVSASIIHELVENPALGKAGRVPFGDDSMEWLYVDDAARGSLLASKLPLTKTRDFLVIGDLRIVREVGDYVKKLLPDADITVLPGATGFGFEPRTKPVDEKRECLFEWPLEQGIKETINTIRRQNGLPPVE